MKTKTSYIVTYFLLLLSFTSQAQVDIVYSDLVWSDEFDGSGAINTTKWHHQTQLPAGGSWFNGEAQHYTNLTSNSFVQNGNLHIVAKKENYTDQGITKEYTSARLNSKFAFKYGRVDVRAKLPLEQGTWPAIWMLGKNVNEDGAFFDANFGTTNWPACGEIDIMEHGITPSQPVNYIQSAIHTPSSYGSTVNIGGTIATDLGNQFHVYSVNWSPTQLSFLLDGVVFYTYNPSNKNASNWPFDLEQYLLLNIAMGGVAGTINPNYSQSEMVIDYVRVYQNTQVDTQQPTGFNVSTGTLSSSSIELLLNGLDNSGNVIYTITYGTNTITTTGTSGIQKSLVIPNLNPNTTYTFTITAADQSGNLAANNPQQVTATTLGFVGCTGTSSIAQIGAFSTGYTYSFETIGNSVKIIFQMLDTDKVGVVAYLWKQTPFTEYPMTNVSGNTFSYLVTNQQLGSTISYAVKFAYANGMSVTQYINYTVGNTCALNLNSFSTSKIKLYPNPTNDKLYFETDTKLKKIEVYSIAGVKICDCSFTADAIDVSSLANGAYVIIMYNQENKRVFTDKIILH